jgi:hypothetical protein
MTMRPRLPEPSTVPGLIKAKPCGTALNRAGLDNGPAQRPRIVAKLVAHGRHELPPMPRTVYTAFCDPSGGSADSFTLSICHREKDVAVVDLIREIRPPFSPENTVEELSKVLKQYRCASVCGDKYAGLWPAEQFQKRGIRYEASERTASEIYLEMLSIINSGRVELLDNRRCIAQLIGLERRTTRLGKDTVSHGPGGHDDVINSVAGCVVRSITKMPIRISEAQKLVALHGPGASGYLGGRGYPPGWDHR